MRRLPLTILMLGTAIALSACANRPTAQDAPAAPAATATTQHLEDFEMPADWTARQTPLRLYGNSYYVGSKGISTVLIDTGAGLILLDTGVEQNRAQLTANIQALGFNPNDIKYILISEQHFDHAAAAPALSAATGATVVASPQSVAALRAGHPAADDPQYAMLSTITAGRAPVTRLREIRDGETLQLGNTTIRAIATPGHTTGSMSWSWQSCVGTACKSMLFASSLNAVSAGDYRWSAHPDLIARLRQSMARIRSAPCDVLISAHPDNSDLNPLLDQLAASPDGPNPLLRSGACAAYADGAEQRLQTRLQRDASGG